MHIACLPSMTSMTKIGVMVLPRRERQSLALAFVLCMPGLPSVCPIDQAHDVATHLKQTIKLGC